MRQESRAHPLPVHHRWRRTESCDSAQSVDPHHRPGSVRFLGARHWRAAGDLEDMKILLIVRALVGPSLAHRKKHQVWDRASGAAWGTSNTAQSGGTANKKESDDHFGDGG